MKKYLSGSNNETRPITRTLQTLPMTIWGSAQFVGSEAIKQKTAARGLQCFGQANEVDKTDGQINDANHAHHDTEVA